MYRASNLSPMLANGERPYRYTTTRDWGRNPVEPIRDWGRNPVEPIKSITWIGAHPGYVIESEEDDAPTLRCLDLSRSWGFNRMVVVNIFAFRARTMWALKNRNLAEAIGEESAPYGTVSHGDRQGGKNDRMILMACADAHKVVACWGNAGLIGGRGDRVREMLVANGIQLHHMGTTRKGEPMHVSYVPKTVGTRVWAI